MTEDEARDQAQRERAEWLELLQTNGDKMAVDLSKKLGMPVDFTLKPSRSRAYDVPTDVQPDPKP